MKDMDDRSGTRMTSPRHRTQADRCQRQLPPDGTNTTAVASLALECRSLGKIFDWGRPPVYATLLTSVAEQSDLRANWMNDRRIFFQEFFSFGDRFVQFQCTVIMRQWMLFQIQWCFFGRLCRYKGDKRFLKMVFRIAEEFVVAFDFGGQVLIFPYLQVRICIFSQQ